MDELECRILVCPICAECGYTMYFEIASVSCLNVECEIFEKKFYRPTIVLEAIK